MFVGEAPGQQEDLQGIPFVGRAGQLLNELLAENGLARDDVFIANVLKSRPPGNRDPQPDEIEACKPYLFRQVELIEPTVICTLGNFSTKLLTRGPDRHQPGPRRPTGPPARPAHGQDLPDLPPGRRPAHSERQGDPARGLQEAAGSARRGPAAAGGRSRRQRIPLHKRIPNLPSTSRRIFSRPRVIRARPPRLDGCQSPHPTRRSKMFRRIRKHANPASLIAMVALFVALGGVSYAAATIGSAQIKNNSVQEKSEHHRTARSSRRTSRRAPATALRGQQGPPGHPGTVRRRIEPLRGRQRPGRRRQRVAGARQGRRLGRRGDRDPRPVQPRRQRLRLDREQEPAGRRRRGRRPRPGGAVDDRATTPSTCALARRPGRSPTRPFHVTVIC